TTSFELKPRDEKSVFARELGENSEINIVVDRKTGLIVELTMKDQKKAVSVKAVSLELDCPVGDALRMPPEVKKLGLIDSETGKPVEE
ncbi:MAG: hypothetical protein N2C14_22155, partial [Planctomycetales bacterium]